MVAAISNTVQRQEELERRVRVNGGAFMVPEGVVRDTDPDTLYDSFRRFMGEKRELRGLLRPGERLVNGVTHQVPDSQGTPLSVGDMVMCPTYAPAYSKVWTDEGTVVGFAQRDDVGDISMAPTYRAETEEDKIGVEPGKPYALVVVQGGLYGAPLEACQQQNQDS